MRSEGHERPSPSRIDRPPPRQILSPAYLKLLVAFGLALILWNYFDERRAQRRTMEAQEAEIDLLKARLIGFEDLGRRVIALEERLKARIDEQDRAHSNLKTEIDAALVGVSLNQGKIEALRDQRGN